MYMHQLVFHHKRLVDLIDVMKMETQRFKTLNFQFQNRCCGEPCYPQERVKENSIKLLQKSVDPQQLRTLSTDYFFDAAPYVSYA